VRKDSFDPRKIDVEDQRSSVLSYLMDYLDKSRKGLSIIDDIPDVMGEYPSSPPTDNISDTLYKMLESADTAFRRRNFQKKEGISDFHGNVYKTLDDYIMNRRQYQRSRIDGR